MTQINQTTPHRVQARFKGAFGELVVELTFIPDRNMMLLTVTQSIGREVLEGKREIIYNGVVFKNEDVYEMMNRMKITNSLSSGLGKMWTFQFPYEYTLANGAKKSLVPTVFMGLTPKSPMLYNTYNMPRDTIRCRSFHRTAIY